jgi:hypothetical protein
MPGSDRYRPVDRWAYTARPLPRAGQVVRLALAAGVAALWFVAHDGTPWSRLAGPGLVVAYLAAVVWSLRRRASSLVVDAPGIYLGDAYVRENEERLVHWETVAGIVVFPGRGSRRPAAVGVRLRRHPGVVAVRRELDGWSVSRRKLASAVARYAPGVPVVDAPPGAPAAPQASVDHPVGLRSVARGGHRRYEPADPHAYVARPTPWRDPATLVALSISVVAGVLILRHGLTAVSLVVSAVLAAGFLGPAAVHAVGAARGEVRFAVDAPGVFFGRTGPGEPAGAGLVPWAAVTSIVVFEVRAKHTGGRAVGVTSVPAGGGEPVVSYHRVMHGWRLDRARLEAAARHFAPQVPVVDGLHPAGR